MMNNTLMEKERSMINGVGLGLEFWGDEVDTTCYLFNASPLLGLEDKTPHEICNSNKPSFSHLKVFGCDAYVRVPKDKRIKMDSKYERCIFIWYKYGLKGYKFWKP